MSLMFVSKSQQVQAQNFQDWKDKCITYNLWKEIEIGSSKGCRNRNKKISYNTNQLLNENACKKCMFTFNDLTKPFLNFLSLYHNHQIKTSISIQALIKTLRSIHSMCFIHMVVAPLKALFWLQ